jgi:hypothetical protein
MELDVPGAVRRAAEAANWRVADSGRAWVEAWPRSAGGAPAQGWKLHISAVPGSASDVLERSLAVLARESAPFKVARSLDALIGLNEGAAGLSQVGKFITVYPRDDAQAVRLASALDRATAGLLGPSVPSDRPLRLGSVVHYRYGSFGGELMQLPHGELASVLRDPDDRLVADRRETFYEPPAWAEDPFLAAGVADELTEERRLVAGRWLPVALLHRSPRGAVELGIDLEKNARCVLKRARRGAAASVSGSDAVDHLRNEARILERICAEGIAPEQLGLVEEHNELWLAMEDVPGPTLAARVAALRARGLTADTADVVAIGLALARGLARLHANGVVHRDVKPSNFISSADGALRMVDLELAHELEGSSAPFGLGTHGYMSPQQRRGMPPTVADDIHGLGATLFFVATGADPSGAPEDKPLTARPLELLAPSLDPRVRSLIESCLDPDPAARPATMDDLEAAFAACAERAPTKPRSRRRPSRADESQARERSRERALALGLTLARSALPAPGGIGRGWDSGHEAARGFAGRDVNAGTAGNVLALAELVDVFDHRELRLALLDAVAWLVAAASPAGDPLPGLYVGEAGIALALLRAGQVLELRELVEAAGERLRQVSEFPHVSPDLFNGSAGRLRAHLIAFDATGDRDQLAAAQTSAHAITAAARERDGGGVAWEIPAGYGGLSGRVHTGYAHGAAGIGDGLLDFTDVTGDVETREAARRACEWIARLATPSLADGTGRSWPVEEGAEPAGAVWCHGAGGIGQFLDHAALLKLLPEAGTLAEAAARTVAAAGRSLGPVQCHGLAGCIEFLLDRFRADQDERHLEEARVLERLLDAFAVDSPAGPAWYSDHPTLVAPGYMVGYTGVAMCLLRLADPERRPRQLSREGFAFRAGGFRNSV